MTQLLPALTLAAAATLAALPATAQERPAISLSYDMGIGAKVQPRYEGSDEDRTRPWTIFRNFDITLGDQGAAGGAAQGFHFGPSFVLVGARKTGPEAAEALRGLDPVDSGLEAGLRLGWRSGPVGVYGTARKAIRAHHGITGEMGVSLTMRPADRWTLVSSVEAQYGDRRFMDAYFDISAEEAARSGHPEYHAGAGIKAHAVTLEARYKATEDWSVLGRVQAKRLTGDAADSPVVKDRDQLWVGVGVMRHFNFRF